MKRVILFVMLTSLFMAGCNTSCSERLKNLYEKNQKALVQTQEANGFTLTMTFIPTRMLPRAEEIGDEQDSSAFYYFKLQVQCPPGPDKMDARKLHYGLDSLFSSTDSSFTLPSLIEPVITGRQQFYEYLLIFPVEAFKKTPKLKVFFHDRLFTNNRLAFQFERSIIEEIEILPCYATKA